MKKKTLFIVTILALFIGIALGATIKSLPVPATWASSVGNYFRIKADANVEVRKTGTSLAGIGTNTFTASSQAVPLTNGVMLRFVNGIYVGTNAP